MIVYNKSSKTLTGFQAAVESLTEVQVRIQPAPAQVESGEEVALLVAAECLRPFKTAVNATVSFNLGAQQHSYTLRLPILLSSFFEPVPSDKATYMARWKALDNEVQDIFTAGHALDSEYLLHLRTVLFARLKIGLAADLDPTERTITGSFSFQTGSATAEGSLISVGGMLRLEADPAGGRIRVTIRAKHPLVSEAVRDVFKLLLE